MTHRIASPAGLRAGARVFAFAAFAALLALAIVSPQAPAKQRSLEFSKVTSPRLHGFATGADDSGFNSAATADSTIAQAREVGAQYARVVVKWSEIAPAGAMRPAGFDARDPADPRYRWTAIDATIARLTAAGLTVYCVVYGAPEWAQRAPHSPDASEFGSFGHALATRYSGLFADAWSGALLPRVRIWQAWNEPNLPIFLAPASPERYRGLLNAFYDEVKVVQPDSTIVAAGLAPVKSSKDAEYPKSFAADLLCVRPSGGWYAATKSCSKRAKFDVFSVHPYSLGAGPTQRAAIAGNMFVADVIDVAQMVRAATQLKTVRPAGRKGLWSTEFAWFTNPPSRSVGDPPRRAGARTLVALHELWRAGVSQVTWFAVSDNSSAIIGGGGLYDTAGNPKPTRDALSFPFYVAVSKRVGYVWGRAPMGATQPVRVERRGKRGFRTVLTFRPRGDGLFSLRFKLPTPGRATFRARQDQRTSLPLVATRGID